MAGAAASAGWMSPEFVPGLVSVIVPTYNRRHLVAEALESVVAQSWRPIELIVVDDGSSDGTAEAVEAWWRDLPPARAAGLELRLLRRENGGQSAARNGGLAASRGEFIQYLDSDDLLHPRKLEVHVGRLQRRPALGYVYSSAVGFSVEPDWMDRPVYGTPRSKEVERHLTCEDFLPVWAALYRRSTCLAIGPWHEGLLIDDDLEYNLRLLMILCEGEFIEGNYCAYRQHADKRATDLVGTERALAQFPLMAEAVSAVAAGNAGIMELLAAQSFRLSLQAMRLGGYDTAREAVRHGLPCARSRSRRWKLRVLAILLTPGVPDICRRRGAEGLVALAARRRRKAVEAT